VGRIVKTDGDCPTVIGSFDAWTVITTAERCGREGYDVAMTTGLSARPVRPMPAVRLTAGLSLAAPAAKQGIPENVKVSTRSIVLYPERRTPGDFEAPPVAAVRLV
jgi:hypothetical protein